MPGLVTEGHFHRVADLQLAAAIGYPKILDWI
jgi:hypothetical protein